METILEWPICVLRPQQGAPNPVPFTRSGGRSLGGVDPAIRTDLGFWLIDYQNVVLQNRRRDQWQTWQAIRSYLSGRTGLIAVPVRSSLSAPYVSGAFEEMPETPYEDDTEYDDDTPHVQGAISIVTDGVTLIGATTIRLRIINAAANLVGVRFSYQHALYETGPLIDVAGGTRYYYVARAEDDSGNGGGDVAGCGDVGAQDTVLVVRECGEVGGELAGAADELDITA